jgi:transglutaminase-like putative cysteine protease
VFAGYLMLIVFRTGPGSAWTDLTSTWSSLLTSTTPAVASPTIVAGPVLLGWAAALIGGLLAVRSHLSAVPVVPPLVALMVALAFAGTASPGLILYPIVLALVIATVLLVRGPEPGSRARGVGQWTSLLIVMAAALVLAVGVTEAAPAGSTQSRYDLRAYYNPPINMSNMVTPLALVTPSLQQDPKTASPVFTATFSHLPASTTLIPIAYLESYDGAVWGTLAPFSLAGPDLPPGAAGSAPTVTVRQTYKLTNYPSAFLPALEGAHTIGGATLGYDRTTGTLVYPPGPNVNLTYTVSSDVPQIGSGQIRLARPGVDPTVATLALPPANENWPEPILSFAHRYGTGETPLARLDALQKALLSPHEFGYTDHARPGHSFFVLSDFLSQNSKDGFGRIGDSEQFAAAFAVLARIEGFPSRVVVGYKIPDEKQAVAGQPVTIYPQDMHAWSEVDLNGVGWVTFDPSNTTPRNAPHLTSESLSTGTTNATTPANGGSGSHNSGTTTPAATRHHHHRLPWFVIPIVLLAIPALVLAAKKLRRQVRKERGSPSDQVMGAWREARDHLRDRQIRVNRAATLLEVAGGRAEADQDDLGDRISELGLLVDRALYSPEEPDDSDVEAAWEAESGVRDALKGGSDPASRLRNMAASFDPRTLVDSIRR